MMNKKLISIWTLALIGGSTMVATLPTFAAEGSKDVPVSYSNVSEIPDPENPENPDYLVHVPAGIVFTAENKTIDTRVSIVNPDGTTKYNGDKVADVKVASANNFKLKSPKASDEVAYNLLKYGTGDVATALASGDKLGTLNKTIDSIKSNAVLKGEAKTANVYTDTLTYTVISQ